MDQGSLVGSNPWGRKDSDMTNTFAFQKVSLVTAKQLMMGSFMHSGPIVSLKVVSSWSSLETPYHCCPVALSRVGFTSPPKIWSECRD